VNFKDNEVKQSNKLQKNEECSWRRRLSDCKVKEENDSWDYITIIKEAEIQDWQYVYTLSIF